MASFTSAGTPGNSTGGHLLKWVVVSEDERFGPDNAADHIYSAGASVFDAEAPFYKLVSMDDPRLDAFAAETVADAAHAVG